MFFVPRNQPWLGGHHHTSSEGAQSPNSQRGGGFSEPIQRMLSPGHHPLTPLSRALPPRSQQHGSGSTTGNPGRLSLRHLLWVWQPQERPSSPKLPLRDPQRHRLLARPRQIQPKQPAMPWQVAEAGSSWRCPVSDGFPRLVAQMLCRINPHKVTCFFVKY